PGHGYRYRSVRVVILAAADNRWQVGKHGRDDRPGTGESRVDKGDVLPGRADVDDRLHTGDPHRCDRAGKPAVLHPAGRRARHVEVIVRARRALPAERKGAFEELDLEA